MCIVCFRFVQHYAFFAYRLAFSAITQNILTLNLLHTKIFNYLVFRNAQNFIHTKIFTYAVFLSRVLIIFICEKLLSTDAVPTGSVMQTLARVCKFGNIVLSMSHVNRLFN